MTKIYFKDESKTILIYDNIEYYRKKNYFYSKHKKRIILKNFNIPIGKEKSLIYNNIFLNFKECLGNKLFIYLTSFAYSLKYHKKIEILSLSDLYLYKNKIHEKYNIFHEKNFYYNELPYIENNVMLDGYFQSYKYFDDYKEEIIKILNINEFKNNYKKEIGDISLHLIFGDYKNVESDYIILPIEYYINALKLIDESNKIVTIFYEKNLEDQDKINEYINILIKTFPNLTFNKFEDNITDYEELLVISLYKINIIANSTYSWFGAYFNTNENKKIYRPEMWFGYKLLYKSIVDLFPLDWIEILEYKNEDYLQKINKFYYINLEHRKDRYDQINEEFIKMKFDDDKIQRINAIKHIKGAIGCGKSHLLALKDAKQNNYENVIIFEDDFKFLINRNKLNFYLKQLFEYDKDFNICLIGKNVHKSKKINEYLSWSILSATTSCYIINKRFYDALIQNFTEAVLYLENNKPTNIYAIDVYWEKFQGIDGKFYFFNDVLGIQRESYSDIENKDVDYKC